MMNSNISRRQFLKTSTTAISLASLAPRAFAINTGSYKALKPRPDLLPKGADSALAIHQITNDNTPSGHVYMEAQIFTPDSQRFVYRRAAFSHDGDRYNPEHRMMLCDLENGGECYSLTNELGVAGPSISPDGKVMYYFVGEKTGDYETVHLKRVNLDGSGRETVHVLDTFIPGTELPRQQTLSAFHAFLGWQTHRHLLFPGRWQDG